MANFALSNMLAGTPQALTTTVKTIVGVHTVTANLRRGAIYEIKAGTPATPSDAMVTYRVERYTTAAGTSTAATPVSLDPSDSASAMTAGVNHTANPTITATSILWDLPLHMRGTAMWQPAPDQRLIWPATNLNGLSLGALSATATPTVDASFSYAE